MFPQPGPPAHRDSGRVDWLPRMTPASTSTGVADPDQPYRHPWRLADQEECAVFANDICTLFPRGIHSLSTGRNRRTAPSRRASGKHDQPDRRFGNRSHFPWLHRTNIRRILVIRHDADYVASLSGQSVSGATLQDSPGTCRGPDKICAERALLSRLHTPYLFCRLADYGDKRLVQ